MRRIAALKASVRDLKSELQDVIKEKNDLEQRLIRNQQIIDDLRHRDMRAELNDTLESKKFIYNLQRDDLTELQGIVKDMTATKNEQRNMIRNLQARLEEQNDEIWHLQQDGDKLESSINVTEKEIKDLRVELQDLSKDYDLLKQENDILTEGLILSKKAVEDLKANLEDQNRTIYHLNEEGRTLRTAKDECTDRFENNTAICKEEIANLTQEREELQHLYAEVNALLLSEKERMTAEIDNLKSALQAHNSTINHLEQEENALRASKDSMVRRLANQQERLTLLTRLNKNLKTAKDECTDKFENSIALHKEETANLTREREELQTLCDEANALLHSEKERMVAEIDNLKSALQAQNSTITDLRHDYDTLGATLQEMKGKNANLNNQIKDWDQRFSSLKQDCETQKKTLRNDIAIKDEQASKTVPLKYRQGSLKVGYSGFAAKVEVGKTCITFCASPSEDPIWFGPGFV